MSDQPSTADSARPLSRDKAGRAAVEWSMRAGGRTGERADGCRGRCVWKEGGRKQGGERPAVRRVGRWVEAGLHSGSDRASVAAVAEACRSEGILQEGKLED
jgi:hypothetical protein